jgi:poly(3-hydroxybutyrate) depolymerase
MKTIPLPPPPGRHEAWLFVLPAAAALLFWRSPLPGSDIPAVTTRQPQEIASGLGSITTRNYANRQLEYFYYFPTRLCGQPRIPHPVLVIVPGLSGRVRNVDPGTWGKAARDNGWIILSPHFHFDRLNWETATSYQFPAAWSGRALLDIMDDFSSRCHLKLGPCYLHGTSAGAQFVVRFALWRPAMCRAVAAHAGGGTVTPQHYVPVSFFITIGRNDLSRRRQFDWFLQKAAEKGIAIRSKIYPGGHTQPPEQLQDAIRFFQENH